MTSNKNTNSGLAGFQFRYLPFSDLEINALFSMLIGAEKKYDTEMGLGISYNGLKGLIIGAAYFASITNVDERANNHIVGITIKANSSDSPSILIGLNLQKGTNSKPIFQLSYPITAK